MYHNFSIHSSVEGHLGCFQFLATTNSAAMNIVEQKSLLHECVSFGYMPKSGIAGYCGRLIPIFLRSRHTTWDYSTSEPKCHCSISETTWDYSTSQTTWECSTAEAKWDCSTSKTTWDCSTGDYMGMCSIGDYIGLFYIRYYTLLFYMTD